MDDKLRQLLAEIAALGPPSWMDHGIARAGFAVGIQEVCNLIRTRLVENDRR
jgi:hypothetical protein